MKKYFQLSIIIMLILNSCQNHSKKISHNFQSIPNIIDGVIHEPGNWKNDLPAGEEGTSLGYHRVVIKTESGQQINKAHIPWRRNDIDPKEKALILINAKTNTEIINKVVVNQKNEYCDIVFQSNLESEIYYLYYMPYKSTGSYYPVVSYDVPVVEAEPDWLNSIGRLTDESMKQFNQAKVISIQSINEFHSFFPMEVIATESELNILFDPNPQEYYLFPESRELPIRMKRFLPKHWTDRGLLDRFNGEAKLGECYYFQVGVYAKNANLKNLNVNFTDLKSTKGSSISKANINILNINGIDQFGQEFTKSVSVEKNTVLPLWIGVQIPENIKPGQYIGNLTINPENEEAQTIQVELKVVDELAIDCGDNQPENMSRLRWLNSKIGTDPDFIVSPYTPIRVKNKTLSILGRDIILADNGLPKNILSYFTEEMTGFNEQPDEILTSPIKLEVKGKNINEHWKSKSFNINKVNNGQASWVSENNSENFTLRVEGKIEYEGMLNYKLILLSKNDIDVDDIALSIPIKPDAAKYILGLGHKGQKQPNSFNWKWDVSNHHEGVWLGNVNKGLQYVLRDENYERPLNTNFYHSKPLNMPPSWFNEGKGGINIVTNSNEVTVKNYSGSRKIAKGDTLYFNVRFLVTPFKPLDVETHFNTRFVHKYVPVDSVKNWGGTVVNIHHANAINPFINYPFFSLKEQSEYIQEAHQKNIKVKLYYTIRELTYKCHELFALRSLGDEILNDGEGGGHPWLQEHLQEGYHKAWHAWRVDDASILNKGNSRWTNYYIEGLNWLAKNQQIDGLYLDDIAFSRETVKRMVSVLNKNRDEVVIDLHSANQFNDRDGFINSVFLYMEHIPFVSRLWFGEYFEYDKNEDYWLTEVSGIPFGLMGEMLEKGGHPYRGMLYGMTTRVYGKFDPRPIWKLFDEFGIAQSRMIGYWVESNPVRTNNDKIFATTYINENSILITLASWAPEDIKLKLDIDWKKLGILHPEKVKITIPAIQGLQKFKKISINELIHIDKEQGLFVLIEKE